MSTNQPNAPIECERKYLIKHPGRDELARKDGAAVYALTQTYLKRENEKDPVSRVRTSTKDGKTSYIKTSKTRLTDLSNIEEEHEISKEAYDKELLERDPSLERIEKTRVKIPFGGQTLEFDLYPFWNDFAILEIELPSEESSVHIPDWVEVVKDVTGDSRFKNYALAKPDQRLKLTEELKTLSCAK